MVVPSLPSPPLPSLPSSLSLDSSPPFPLAPRYIRSYLIRSPTLLSTSPYHLLLTLHPYLHNIPPSLPLPLPTLLSTPLLLSPVGTRMHHRSPLSRRSSSSVLLSMIVRCRVVVLSLPSVVVLLLLLLGRRSGVLLLLLLSLSVLRWSLLSRRCETSRRGRERGRDDARLLNDGIVGVGSDVQSSVDRGGDGLDLGTEFLFNTVEVESIFVRYQVDAVERDGVSCGREHGGKGTHASPR
jgi:hypothetical protein